MLSLLAFSAWISTGACKFSSDEPQAAAPQGLKGYWSDGGMPERYWVFGQQSAVIDSPFDATAGYFVVRAAKYTVTDRSLLFGGGGNALPRQYELENDTGSELTIGHAGASTRLKRLTSKDIARIFGAKYAADPDSWIADVQAGTYRRE